MPTLLWKIKSRIETILQTSGPFRDLLPSVLGGLSKKDLFFVEIGANDGITDDPIYEYVKKNNWSGVYVEPQKRVFEKLKKNFEGKNNVFFENIAITEKEEEVTLYVPNSQGNYNNSVFASLSPNSGSLASFDATEMQKETVQGMPLSYLVEKYELDKKPLVFLLIDVEGHEKPIFSAIERLSFSPSYILFEHVHMSHLEHRAINNSLLSLGYGVYVGHNDTLAYKSKK
jgi:FkbM family methyltransferase